MDPIITILGLIVAGLALYRNVVLTKEQVSAKDAQIATLNSQVELLKQLTPAAVYEHYIGMKSLLEERIDEGLKKLEKAESAVASHRKQLDTLETEAQKQAPDVGVAHFRRVIIILKIMFNMAHGASGAWSVLTAYVAKGIEKSNENAPSSKKISRQLYDLTEKLYDHWIEQTDQLMECPDEEFYTRLVDFSYRDEVQKIWSDLLEIGDLLYPFLDEEEQPAEKPS